MLYSVYWYLRGPLFRADIEKVELSEDDFDPEQYGLEEDQAEAIALSRIKERFPEAESVYTVVLSLPKNDRRG